MISPRRGLLTSVSLLVVLLLLAALANTAVLGQDTLEATEESGLANDLAASAYEELPDELKAEADAENIAYDIARKGFTRIIPGIQPGTEIVEVWRRGVFVEPERYEEGWMREVAVYTVPNRNIRIHLEISPEGIMPNNYKNIRFSDVWNNTFPQWFEQNFGSEVRDLDVFWSFPRRFDPSTERPSNMQVLFYRDDGTTAFALGIQQIDSSTIFIREYIGGSVSNDIAQAEFDMSSGLMYGMFFWKNANFNVTDAQRYLFGNERTFLPFYQSLITTSGSGMSAEQKTRLVIITQ